jgi:hypothetical protein
MLPLPQIFHRLFQFFKGKYPIVHWLYLVLAMARVMASNESRWPTVIP